MKHVYLVLLTLFLFPLATVFAVVEEEPTPESYENVFVIDPLEKELFTLIGNINLKSREIAEQLQDVTLRVQLVVTMMTKENYSETSNLCAWLFFIRCQAEQVETEKIDINTDMTEAAQSLTKEKISSVLDRMKSYNRSILSLEVRLAELSQKIRPQ